jgi:hypothetical protein
METAEELRRLAERAMRLARGIGSPDVADQLKLSAAEYLRLANELEAQQRPRQQQQPQPNKKDE